MVLNSCNQLTGIKTLVRDSSGLETFNFDLPGAGRGQVRSIGNFCKPSATKRSHAG